jgi:carbon-monoxide dehydrogenase small subunit/xanthine dehydrogenase small subunit
MKLSFTVNGTTRSLETEPLKRLLDILREDLKLRGAKEGCGEGECGACAVIIDGELVNSCMVPALQVHGRNVLTIEGLGSTETPDSLQQYFADEGAVQCGFCIPGMIMASRSLLEADPHPERSLIRKALAGNLCRCTGYEKIFRAVEMAAESGYGEHLKMEYPEMAEYVPPLFSKDEEELFFQPSSLEDALRIRNRFGGEICFLAGGTDFFPDLKNGKKEYHRILDLSRVPELAVIERRGESLFIGATASDTRLVHDADVAALFPSLSRSAELSGAWAVQNRATLGGNLASASGAADLPVPLLVLDASVVLRSTDGERLVPMEQFFTGYRKTVLQDDEIISGVLLPLPKNNLAQAFYKRGSRAALTLARISVACAASLDDGRIEEIRIAAGSMSAFPVRLPETEDFLRGKRLEPLLPGKAAAVATNEISPRKSGPFRKSVTGNLVRKFLLSLLDCRKDGELPGKNRDSRK